MSWLISTSALFGAGFSELPSSSLTVTNGRAQWVDFDNDGDLDLFISGYNRRPAAKLFRNNGAGNFTETGQDLGIAGTGNWLDIDRDGDLDLLLTGTYVREEFGDYYYPGQTNEVFLNDGQGQLSPGADLPESWISVGDINNDGVPDFLWHPTPTRHQFGNLLLRDGRLTFVGIQSGLGPTLYGVQAWKDFDRDGDLDALYIEASGASPQTRLFRNDGDFSFVELPLGLPGYAPLPSWDDFDGDAYPDLFFRHYNFGNISQILYHNEGDGRFTQTTVALRGSGEEAVAADFDSDGRLDLLWPASGDGSTNYYAHRLYRNLGGSFVLESNPFPPRRWGQAAWGDANNDGTLDVILLGSFPSRDGPSGTALFANHYSPNTPPTAPTGLTAQQVGDRLVFRWNSGADLETPASLLTYDLRIGTTPGGVDVVAPMAHPVTGYRRLPQAGTVLSTQWALSDLKKGTYYWSVQAVDTGSRGSAWAPEQAITIGNTAPRITAPKEIHAAPSRGGTIAFTLADAESAVAELVVSTESANATFISPASLSLQGTSTNRTLGFQVARGQIGTNFIILTVRDPGGLFSQTRVQVVSDFFTVEPVASATNFVSLLPLPMGYGYPPGAPVVDVDRDGDLDVLLVGTILSNNVQSSHFVIALNGGRGDFTLTIVPQLILPGMGMWFDDFDRDGDVDLLSTGDYYSPRPAQLYVNDGDGNFAPAQQVGPTDLSLFADLDNDGDLDGLRLDLSRSSLFLEHYENRAGIFRLRPGPLWSVNAYHYQGNARVTDIDRDGDMDFLIPGVNTNNFAGLVIRTLRNNGSGRFTPENWTIIDPATLPATLFGVYTYDADDDGDLDVPFFYETNYAGPILQGVASNNAQGRFSFVPISRMPGPFAADFDNDGDLDRLIDELIGTDPVRVRYRLHLKNAAGQYVPHGFTISDPGFEADFDGDGDLDYLAITEEKDEYGYLLSARQLRFYRNNLDTTNAPPTAPGGLRMTQQSDDRVTFAWNPSTDDHTPSGQLTYNLRVGTIPGGVDVVAPCADVATGRRWLSGAGNVGTLLFRDLRALPAATYYWSVQAVDGVFSASTWAPEQTFTINRPSISAIDDIVTPPGVVSEPIRFTVTGGASALEALRISVVADDTNLLPSANMMLTGTGEERTLTMTPSPYSADTEIAVTATDQAGFSAIRRVHVRVAWWDARSLEPIGIQWFQQGHFADVNLDGLLDFLGYSPVGTAQLLSYLNLGGTRFQSVSNELPQELVNSVHAGGFGGDDIVDLFTARRIDDFTSVLGVWRGTSEGFEFQSLNEVTNRAVVHLPIWIDLDNDGWRDVVHFGFANPAPPNAPGWGLLMARGKPDGTFEYLPTRIGIYSGQAIAAGDFDADGDFDLLVSGYDYAANGRDIGNRFNRLYLNQGNGSFVPNPAGLLQDIPYNFSVIDYDLDGRVDVLLLPPPSSPSTNRPHLMRNLGGTFSEIPADLPALLNQVAWADFDNDGDPDLLAFTTAQFPSLGVESYRAAIYRNDLGALTKADTGLPEIVAHQAAFADVDNDGDLDLLILGETGWNQTGRLLCLNKSPKRNLSPTAPTGLIATQDLDSTLLQWSPAVDPENSAAITYNLRLGTTPGGSEIVPALADPVTGQRRLTGPGNIGHAPRWRLVLPEGQYYWSVQAVDAAYAGSPLATEQGLIVSRPRLSAISNVVVRLSEPTLPLAFSITGGTAPFTLSAEASDASLVGSEGFGFGGSDRTRTLTVTPRAGRNGTARIMVLAVDSAGGRGSTTFEITVLPALTLLTEISPAIAAASLAWGDADRDQDLDLLISGSRYDTFGFRGNILRNDGSGLFNSILAELTPLNRGEVGWGDFDRDGDLDAVLIGYNDSQNPDVALHRNNLPIASGFTRVSGTRLPSLGDSSLAWLDGDGDGDLDLLTAGAANNGVRQAAALYLNNGSGSFSNGLVALPAVSQGSIAVADFDGDGAPDFLLTGSTDGTVDGAITRLYRNQGRGYFEPVAVALPDVFRSAAVWADFDRDGDPDLVLAGASRNGALTQLFRNHGGSLQLALNLPGVVDGALAAGDLDGDGFPDLALSGRSGLYNGTLISRIYLGGAGTFRDSGTPLPGMHFSAMAWGDADRDGRLDLALAGSTNEALNLFSGAAYTALFRNSLGVTVPTLPSAPGDLAADVNGSDVVLSWSAPPGASPGLSFDVRIGRTPGGSEVTTPFADSSSGWRRVAQPGQAGWSRRCALRNLPAATYYWSAQSVDAAYRGSLFAAEAQFTIVNLQPTITAIPPQAMPMNSSLGPLSFQVADPDGDAAALLVSAVASDPDVFPPGSIILQGNGTARTVMLTPARNEAGTVTVIFTVRDPQGGISTASTRVQVQSLTDVQGGFPDGQFSVLEPADVDNDGDLDLLLAGTESTGASSGRASVRLFLNAGDATFTVAIPPLPPVFDGAFAAWGDYDADGDQDLFYAGTIYRNDGGALVPIDLGLSGIRNGQAAWGDYDQDGDLDLALSGQLSNGLPTTRIYRNDGGTFVDINALLFPPLHYSSLAWGDPDGDGDLDLAVAGAASQNLQASPNARLYRNWGNDVFGEAANLFGIVNGTVLWADVNGDGRADLMATGSHGLAPVNNLHLNLGDWRFVNLPLTTGSDIPWTDTRLLDWDNDGDVDLLVGVNSIVGVFPNLGTGEFSSSFAASTSIRCRALRFGDFDNDADFDVLVSNTGTSGFTGTTRMYRNLQVLAALPPVATLSSEVESNSVALRWPLAQRLNGAPVTYNVRVGTAPGNGDVLSPLSRADGRRLVPQPGNAGYASVLKLRELPPATYYWTVQAVDSGWHGQPWAPEESFTISSTVPVAIKSFRLLTPTQARIRFQAPAGRQVALQGSQNLASWSELTVIQVGASGQAETTLAVGNTPTFIRLQVR